MYADRLPNDNSSALKNAELPTLFEGIDKHARLVHARLVGAEVLSPTPNGLHVEAD
jgi:hypothetical protein